MTTPAPTDIRSPPSSVLPPYHSEHEPPSPSPQIIANIPHPDTTTPDSLSAPPVALTPAVRVDSMEGADSLVSTPTVVTSSVFSPPQCNAAAANNMSCAHTLQQPLVSIAVPPTALPSAANT